MLQGACYLRREVPDHWRVHFQRKRTQKDVACLAGQCVTKKQNYYLPQQHQSNSTFESSSFFPIQRFQITAYWKFPRDHRSFHCRRSANMSRHSCSSWWSLSLHYYRHGSCWSHSSLLRGWFIPHEKQPVQVASDKAISKTLGNLWFHWTKGPNLRYFYILRKFLLTVSI